MNEPNRKTLDAPEHLAETGNLPASVNDRATRPKDSSKKSWRRNLGVHSLIVAFLGLLAALYPHFRPLFSRGACADGVDTTSQKLKMKVTGRVSFELAELNRGRLLGLLVSDKNLFDSSSSMGLVNLEIVAGNAGAVLTLTSAIDALEQSLKLETDPPEALVTVITSSGRTQNLTGPLQLRLKGVEVLELLGELAEPVVLSLDGGAACWKTPMLRSLVLTNGTLVATRTHS